jgi:hypothetical protein
MVRSVLKIHDRISITHALISCFSGRATLEEDVLLHVILAAVILALLRGIGMKRFVEGTDRG